jgi:hypothetical protein
MQVVIQLVVHGHGHWFTILAFALILYVWDGHMCCMYNPSLGLRWQQLRKNMPSARIYDS